MSNLWEAVKKLFKIGDRATGNVPRPVQKKLTRLIILAAAGILLIVLANVFGTGRGTGSGTGSGASERQAGPVPAAKQPEDQAGQDPASDLTKLENLLAQRLEQALNQISGAGQVRVTVNLASTTQKDYAVNTNTNSKNTQEHDQKGGNRVITETDENEQMVLVRENQGNKEEPVVVKEIKPEVKGVIVVAEGAEDPAIKADLVKAVQVYLSLPAHRVIVLPKEAGD